MKFESITEQKKDLESIAEGNIDFSLFRDSRVFITGATGLIGSSLVKLFLLCNKKLDLNIHVVAMVRNENKAARCYGDLLHEKNLEIYVGDIRENISYEKPIDYIFHAASITASKTMVNDPVGTIEIAYQGTRNMLDLAHSNKVKGFVYISSMEVYGIPDENLNFVKEQDLGYIDLFNVRSSYSEGKRICECLCKAYQAEYEVPVKVARLAQTFGAGVFEDDNRIYAQIARSVIENKDIILHSDGKSEGNYCYLKDTIEGIILIALKGNPGEAYNVVNEKMHMEIREMADFVARNIADGKVSVKYEIPENALSFGYAPKVKMKLSGEKLRKLGWRPQIDMKEAYEKMIQDMKLADLR